MSENKPHRAGMSRRTALKGIGAGGAAALTLGQTAAAQTGDATEADVVVIGAGAAGTLAARDLAEAGRSVVLIEANERVGGRLKRGEIAGQVIDLGGQWVGPQQTLAMELSDQLGLTRYPTHVTGENIAVINGDEIRFTGDTPNLEGAALLELGQIMARLNVQAQEVSTAAPWTAGNAQAWDSITVDTWMRENIKEPAVRALMRFIIQAVCSVEPSQISYLQWLFYIKSGVSLEILTGTTNAAQQDLFVEGFHAIPARIAEGLGDRVVLGSPVRAIVQKSGHVLVHTDKGTWKARRVIVTAPPATASRIDYIPALPYARRGLMQRMPMGTVIKCFLAYETPFWREKGLTGQGLNTDAAFGLFYDITAPGRSRGVLSGFFDGGPAQAWADRSEDERRERVIDDVAAILGRKARNPMAYVEQNWPREPWSIGGYTSIPGPGVITHFGQALLEPCGRIHWAGTETAQEWSGYVEGALRSGRRAAAEVLDVIRAESA